jgi:hypothetical protein
MHSKPDARSDFSKIVTQHIWPLSCFNWLYLGKVDTGLLQRTIVFGRYLGRQGSGPVHAETSCASTLLHPNGQEL